MKKILLYAANGVGLGHLQRMRIIAEKLVSKYQVILATSAPQPNILGHYYHKLIRLTPLTDQLLKRPAKTLAARLDNGRTLLKKVMVEKPDLIVADFYLNSPFTYYPLSQVIDKYNSKIIYIWRIGDQQSFINEYQRCWGKLSNFIKVILPHTYDELSVNLPNKFVAEIKRNKKIALVGNIYRSPNLSQFLKTKDKYKIKDDDYLILITLGGGGKLFGGQCDNPGVLLGVVKKIIPNLKKRIPQLKIIIITGPNYQGKFLNNQFIKTVVFEKNILDIMYLAKFVIATAGYNTCNELVAIKKPAILYPIMRGNREQFVRAKALKREGVAEVFSNNLPNELLRLVNKITNNLDSMEGKMRQLKQSNGLYKTLRLIEKYL